MTTKTWAQGLISKLVDWFTRKRNLGLSLVLISSSLITLTTGGISMEWQGMAGVSGPLKASTGEGLSGNLLSLVVCLAAILGIVGLGLILWSWHSERRDTDINRVLVVEMRGLVDTTDHPLKNAVPAALPGRRIDRLVNVRPLLTGPSPNVAEALKEIDHIRRDVHAARGDTSREHVKVVVGGVMQVPLLFFAGSLLDDEGKVFILDWERTTGRWRELDQVDDGNRFVVTGTDAVGHSAEVVLAVSASYKADLDAITQTFPGFPLVHLAKPNPIPNTLWSEQTQTALTQQFLETMGALANNGVKIVHLVLAAPSSLCLRFGTAYDHRNMPNLLCYQRERDHVPPYPWSVQMPTAVLPVAFVPTSKPAVVAT